MHTVDLETLVDFLDELLLPKAVQDYCPNGLQVAGRSPIKKVVTAVSASLELFQKAAERGADSILVHHGVFWNGASPVLTGVSYHRIRELLLAEMSLIAYHLPLDRHPTVGNNALAARELGLQNIQPFGEHKGIDIGCMGSLVESCDARTLGDMCAKVFRQKPLVLGPTTQPQPTIRRVGIVSGAAQEQLYRAIDIGLDAFISGEVSEWVMHLARESGLTYVAAGHYATETLGVKRLAELIAEDIGIEAEFIDVPNPV